MQEKADHLKRPVVESLDAVLGKKFNVLDDGFIRVVDYMGSDESIVQAARVSYGKGTKKVSEDRGLIRYLMRHQHSTPFEMCELKLHVRVPMDAWRQWIRHRTANVNEYSTRYSVAIDAAQETLPDQWRLQAAQNKQGSHGFMDAGQGKFFTDQEKELHQNTREIYENRIKAGIAREQARKDLPLATYTEAYWKIDLHNLFHFLALRMDEHAQYEIREYAKIIGHEIVSKWCPMAWEAFMDYRFSGFKFTRQEHEILRELIQGNQEKARSIAESFGFLNYEEGKLKRNRERSELEEKLKQFNLTIPW
ncbi:MAG: FAD-dependent thymidylate synthase [Calditrichaceae bacterium]